MFLERVLRGSLQTTHPRDPVIASWLGISAATSSGVSVTADQAMRFGVVAACVRILSESVGSLPAHVYRRLARGKQVSSTHPLYRIIHDQPNRWQTAVEFWEMVVQHMVLRGNFYARIVGSGLSAVEELIPLHPDRVTPFRAPNGSIAYRYQPENGPEVVYLQEEIFHVRDMTSDGIVGMSRIEGAREAVGLGIALEQFGARFFGNGTTVSGVLEHPEKLSDEAYNRLRKSWADRHQGVSNAHKPAILEEGMKFTQLGIPPDQAQFLDSRKFSKDEICMIFRVPPHMVANLERATFSNIEHQSLELVKFSLVPIIRRIEQAAQRDLFSTKSKSTHFIKFSVDGLLRGDIKSRYEAYQIGRNGGWLSANDIREFEDQNPLDGDQGEVYLVPLNMIPADKVGEIEPKSTVKQRTVRAYRAVFHNAFDKIATCEVRALRNALKADEFDQKVARFISSHALFVRRHLQPVADAVVDGLLVNGATPDIDARMDALITELVAEHIRELNDAISTADNVEALCDEWDSTRAAALSDAALSTISDFAVSEAINAKA